MDRLPLRFAGMKEKLPELSGQMVWAILRELRCIEALAPVSTKVNHPWRLTLAWGDLGSFAAV